MTKINCFKAYDVRGRVPDELDEDIAYRIGRAYAAFVKPRAVAVGRDIRVSSPALTAALVKGLTDSGVDVLDIGLGGTELVVFRDVQPQARRRHHGHGEPQSAGLQRHEVRARGVAPDQRATRACRTSARSRSATSSGRPAQHAARSAQSTSSPTTSSTCCRTSTSKRSRRSRSSSTPATAAPARSSICSSRTCRSSSSSSTTSPTAASRTACRTRCSRRTACVTIERLPPSDADLGIAWDGDYDRCFFFDEHGQFIEGYYIVGLLAADVPRASHPASASCTTRG